jgi:RNA polymerase sigma-70 factor (ECF subfamily)
MTDQPALQVTEKLSGQGLPADLLDRYAPRGIRYAFSMLRNQADAEEISQEALCRLWAAYPNWKNGDGQSLEKQFPSLYFTAIRNQCIDLIRKRSKRKHIGLDLTVEPAARHESATEPGLETQIAGWLEQLPAQWADALKLKVNGQLSYAEIAEVMNATHAQVRTWIFRARRQLETELDKAGI